MNEELRQLIDEFHEALGKADALKDKIYDYIEDNFDTNRYDIDNYIEDNSNYVFGIDVEHLEELFNGEHLEDLIRG